MNFFKNRSSENARGNNDVQVNQPSPNSVTFTNAHSSSIIISTQHPSHVSVVRNPQLNVSNVMTSPNESFHNEKSSGTVNIAYSGSNNDLNTSHHHQQPPLNIQHPQNRVFHQSYWSWNWPWSNWNQREKVFLLVIVILSLCILSLTSVLSVVLQKNIEYREILFNKFGINV